MDAGKLNERISVLTLQKTETCYGWAADSTTWAKAVKSDKSNLFSRVGLGEKTVIFTMRQRALSLHNAIQWGGKHCFLTDIREIDRMYLEVTAALVRISVCSLWRAESGVDEYKRPVKKAPEKILDFPAVLTEKYQGFMQGEPMAQTEATCVLVAPKAVELKVSDLVDVGNVRYAVHVCHTLDEFKNEYEVYRKADV